MPAALIWLTRLHWVALPPPWVPNDPLPNFICHHQDRVSSGPSTCPPRLRSSGRRMLARCKYRFAKAAFFRERRNSPKVVRGTGVLLPVFVCRQAAGCVLI